MIVVVPRKQLSKLPDPFSIPCQGHEEIHPLVSFFIPIKQLPRLRHLYTITQVPTITSR